MTTKKTDKKANKKDDKKTWQRNYDQAVAMCRDGRGSIFDRVKLLAQVFEDGQFKQDMLAEGRSPTDFLSIPVNETFTTFTELYAMLKTFPNREQWTSGDLPAMRKTLRSILSGQDRKSATVGVDGIESTVTEAERSVKRLSWKDRYIELEKKYQLLEGKYQQLSSDYREMHQAMRCPPSKIA